MTADAGTQREWNFSAALFPSLQNLLLEEEVGGAAQLPEGGLSCLLLQSAGNQMECAMKPHFTGAFIF